MATDPQGARKSVPTIDEDFYNEWVRRKRAAERYAESLPDQRWAGSPARMEAHDAMTTPVDPRVFLHLPVTAPALRAYDDVRHERPVSAALHAGEAVFDGATLLEGGAAVKALARGLATGVAKNGFRLTGKQVSRKLHKMGHAGDEDAAHHFLELAGIPRTVPNFRNHPVFMTVLPKAEHIRLHAKNPALKPYGPLARLWVGAPPWMKAGATLIGARAADAAAWAVEQQQARKPSSRPAPAAYGERPLR